MQDELYFLNKDILSFLQTLIKFSKVTLNTKCPMQLLLVPFSEWFLSPLIPTVHSFYVFLACTGRFVLDLFIYKSLLVINIFEGMSVVLPWDWSEAKTQRHKTPLTHKHLCHCQSTGTSLHFHKLEIYCDLMVHIQVSNWKRSGPGLEMQIVPELRIPMVIWN